MMEGFTPGGTAADRKMAEGTAGLRQWASANEKKQTGEWRQGSPTYKKLHKQWKGGLCRGMALNWVRNEVSGAQQPTLPKKPANPAQAIRLKSHAARDLKTHQASASVFDSSGGRWVDKEGAAVRRMEMKRNAENWNEFAKKNPAFGEVRMSALCNAMLEQNPPPKTGEVWEFISRCLSHQPRRPADETRNTETKRFMERVGFLITFASPVSKEEGHAIAVCRMENQSFKAYDPNLPTYELTAEQLENWFVTIWDCAYGRQAYKWVEVSVVTRLAWAGNDVFSVESLQDHDQLIGHHRNPKK